MSAPMESQPTPPARYGAVARWLHWLTAALVLAAFVLGPGGAEALVYSQGMELQRRTHETLGLAVLALSIARVCWWVVDMRPELPQTPNWMAVGSRVVKVTLYLLLFVAPVTAIVGAWLQGYPLNWLGGDIPAWLPQSRDLGTRLGQIHGWLGDTILWLSGLHATAALFHHFVLRDPVLISMLPRAPRNH